MKNKERLLGSDEPLQFIFSHSALREGWDNPNVFQICTLSESKSEIRKRQEIGRGLRLPVDTDGRRIKDKNINVLTVVANETYEDFSRRLQSEIESETGVKFANRVKNTKDKAIIKLSKQLTPENFPLFFDIWEKIKQRTRYRVELSADEIVRKTTEKLRNFNRFPLSRKPKIESVTARLDFSEQGIKGSLSDAAEVEDKNAVHLIPDIYGYIQTRADVSRRTIYEILNGSGRAEELLVNPQMFLDNVVSAVGQTLDELSAARVEYERIDNQFFDLKMFAAEETETYTANLIKVTRPEKTLFNYIRRRNDFDEDFARRAEADENVEFFFRLPREFKIPTPSGNYTPD